MQGITNTHFWRLIGCDDSRSFCLPYQYVCFYHLSHVLTGTEQSADSWDQTRLPGGVFFSQVMLEYRESRAGFGFWHSSWDDDSSLEHHPLRTSRYILVRLLGTKVWVPACFTKYSTPMIELTLPRPRVWSSPLASNST